MYHFSKEAVLTALTAASSKSDAVSIVSFLLFAVYYFIISLALAELVPVSLQTSGIFKSTNSAALIIPVAIVSHFIIPPKMLIKIVLTLG